MIPIDQITTDGRVRQADGQQVEALAESIGEVGLLNPITVAVDGDRYALIAGMHRLEAARRLGWSEIPATVLYLDEFRRVIAECDENLCAPRLTPAERAEFTRRRKEAYEALHPATGHGGDRKSDQVANLATRSEAPRFTADTAARTGQSERAVQRDAERGEKICEDALALIKGTRLDTGRYLDALKALKPDDQVERVKGDLAAPPAAAPSTAAPNEPTPEEDPDWREVGRLTREAMIAEILGLRADLADEKARRDAAIRERDDLKARLKEATADDQGAVIGSLQKQLQAAKFARDEAMAATKRMERRLKAAEARVKELENMEVIPA